MSGLGDVLELIFARPDTWVPVHAVAREWQDREVGDRVAKRYLRDQPSPWGVRLAYGLAVVVAAPFVAAVALRDLPARVRRRGERPVSPRERQLTVWLDAAGRARLERAWAGDAEPRVSLVRLQDNQPFWKGPGWPEPDVTDVGRLFDHRTLREILSALTLTHVRDDEVAGRAVLVVRAGHGGLPRLLPVADEYELLLDREHGHLLGFVARADGTGYAGLVVTEITYGVEIDPALLAEP